MNEYIFRVTLRTPAKYVRCNDMQDFIYKGIRSIIKDMALELLESPPEGKLYLDDFNRRIKEFQDTSVQVNFYKNKK